MTSFFSTHSDASAGFFGESLVDAAQAIGGASESSVSASAGHLKVVARCQQPGPNRPTSQHTKTMCCASLGWRSAAMRPPTQARGKKLFGVVWLADTTHSVATIQRGH
jgi:hypothetical protein